MGSYLSIRNNTPDHWNVKIGSDMKAVKIFTITSSVLAVISFAVVTGGAAAPLAASLSANGVVSVLGVSTAALAATTAAAASISGIKLAATAVGWAVSMVTLITTQLEKDGMNHLAPGK